MKGFLLALAVAAAGIAYQREAHEIRLDSYDQYTLPGFDAYVYMAMADAPSVFTLSPWGYRILTPWIVRLLPMATADGFKALSLVGLTLAGGLLYLFLRRLGHGALLSLLGVLAYALSAPAEAAVADPFLVEPLTFGLVVALLLAVEAGAGVAPLALLAVLAALAKEGTLVFLPLVYFVRRDRDGDKRAALTAVLAALPAVAVTLLLRTWWASAAAPALPAGDTLWLALWRLIERWPDWWRAVVLGGLLPLAILGALRSSARPLLERYGYFLAVTLALPFFASVYTGDPSVPFFAGDIPRLLIYPLPILIALALEGLEAAIPRLPTAPPPLRYRTKTALALIAVSLALLALPLVTQDRYVRADLSGPRDGRYVLAFCRETLATAATLERGRSVDLEPERHSFVVGKTLPSLMGRMRWFLRDGWGPRPQYGTGPVTTQASEATLVLPCLKPEDWNLVLVASAPQPGSVRVSINGRSVGDIATGAEAAKGRIVVPGGALYRGDNELRFAAAAPGLRLRELRIHPAR